MESPNPFTPAFRNLYDVFEPLGEGGMGTVYRGRHRELDRPVAIKVLKSSASADVARFEREGRVLAAMHHPNILQVFAAGVDGNCPYLVCELVEGETLDGLLARRPPSLRQALEIGVAVAEALRYAHEKGIVHRDVKPANVFIGAENVIKLADFGLARPESGGQVLTAESVIIGTPDYMAPEQVSGDHIGPAADQYALGIMLYRMLTGELPFSSEIVLERALLRLNAPVPSTRKVRAAVPAVVDQTVRRMLSKHPVGRYADMGEVVASLNELLQHLGEFEPPPMDPVETLAPEAEGATVAVATPRSNPGATVVGQRPSSRVPVVGRRTGGQRSISRVPPVTPAARSWGPVFYLCVLCLALLLGVGAFHFPRRPDPLKTPPSNPAALKAPIQWRSGARHVALTWDVYQPTPLVLCITAEKGDPQRRRELSINANVTTTTVRGLQPGVRYAFELKDNSDHLLEHLTIDTLAPRALGELLCRKFYELAAHMFLRVEARERAVRMGTARPGREAAGAKVVERDYERYADSPLKKFDRIAHAANKLVGNQHAKFDPGSRHEWWQQEVDQKAKVLHLPEHVDDFKDLAGSVFADPTVPAAFKTELYKLAASCHDLARVFQRLRVECPLFHDAAAAIHTPEYGAVDKPTLKAPQVELWLLDDHHKKTGGRPEVIFTPGEVVNVHRLDPQDELNSHYYIPGPPDDLYVETILPAETNFFRDLPGTIHVPPGVTHVELAASIGTCRASGFAVLERVGNRASQLAIMRPSTFVDEPVYHRLPAGLLAPQFNLRIELLYNRSQEVHVLRQPGILHWIAIGWDLRP